LERKRARSPKEEGLSRRSNGGHTLRGKRSVVYLKNSKAAPEGSSACFEKGRIEAKGGS